MVQETILLVDDEPHVLELLSVTLEDEEYRILQAKDGEEAMKLVEIGQIDLVMTDLKNRAHSSNNGLFGISLY